MKKFDEKLTNLRKLDATGNDLADYVLQGGKLVILGWAAFEASKYGFKGRFTDEFQPLILHVNTDGGKWQCLIKQDKQVVLEDPLFKGLEGSSQDWNIRMSPTYTRLAEDAEIVLGDSVAPLVAHKRKGAGDCVTINGRSDTVPYRFIQNVTAYAISLKHEWVLEEHRFYHPNFQSATLVLLLSIYRMKKKKIVFIPRFISYEIIKFMFKGFNEVRFKK